MHSCQSDFYTLYTLMCIYISVVRGGVEKGEVGNFNFIEFVSL